MLIVITATSNWKLQTSVVFAQLNHRNTMFIFLAALFIIMLTYKSLENIKWMILEQQMYYKHFSGLIYYIIYRSDVDPAEIFIKGVQVNSAGVGVCGRTFQITLPCCTEFAWGKEYGCYVNYIASI